MNRLEFNKLRAAIRIRNGQSPIVAAKSPQANVALNRFRKLIEAEIASSGCTHLEASRRVAKSNPELQKQIVVEANKGRSRG